VKDKQIHIRVNSKEKRRWFLYANRIGYDDLSKFIRNTINEIIEANQELEKILVIENKKEV